MENALTFQSCFLTLSLLLFLAKPRGRKADHYAADSAVVDRRIASETELDSGLGARGMGHADFDLGVAKGLGGDGPLEVELDLQLSSELPSQLVAVVRIPNDLEEGDDLLVAPQK